MVDFRIGHGPAFPLKFTAEVFVEDFHFYPDGIHYKRDGLEAIYSINAHHSFLSRALNFISAVDVATICLGFSERYSYRVPARQVGVES